MSQLEEIRRWEVEDFVLHVFDTFCTDRWGKSILAYRFYDRGELIFEGADFHCSPLHAIDSDDTVAGILAFLSLRPGDTDLEYFKDYSTRQLEWCQERGEQLGILVCEIEELLQQRRS